MKREQALGPSDVFKSASHWRMHAEEVRTIAEGARDPTVRAMMLRIAADYERLAQHADGNKSTLALVKTSSGASAKAPPSAGGDHPTRDRGAHHYTAIVESSDDAILSKDLNGVITSWNQAAQRLFGYTAAEAVGKPVTLLIPTDRHDEEPMILDRVRRGERIEHYETIRQRKDGSLVDISITVSPIKNDQGEIIGASKIARDIGDRKRSQERQQLLIREMNHRVKNVFALAVSVLNLSGRSASSVPQVIASATDRLSALARAHALTLTLDSNSSSQASRPTSLHSLLKAIIAPHDYRKDMDGCRFSIVGSDVEISEGVISPLALLVHEFATNSTKYGALSVASGTIRIECKDDGKTVKITWSESGGPPVVAPTTTGFGDILIRSTVSGLLGGDIFHDWKPEGLIIRLLIPWERLVGSPLGGNAKQSRPPRR